jgi:hypothetical protein
MFPRSQAVDVFFEQSDPLTTADRPDRVDHIARLKHDRNHDPYGMDSHSTSQCALDQLRVSQIDCALWRQGS